MNAIPSHIAIIMDGNGRWAAARGLPRSKGHSAGAKALEKTINAASALGVKFLTVYAFSAENWLRPKEEISALMALLERSLDSFSKYSKKNMRLLISGRRENLSSKILKKMDAVVNNTASNTGLTINIALNYGSRQEITDALNKLLSAGKTRVEDGELSAYLYSSELPDPELIIRTSGEKRLSNFLLWQAAYAEFYFTDVLWPDFDEAHLNAAIKDYQARKRNFGAI